MQAQAIGKAKSLLAPSSGTEVATLAATLHPLCPASDLEALLRPIPSIFQGAHWLQTWLRTMPGPNVEKAYWLDLRESGGEPFLALPIIARRKAGSPSCPRRISA